MRWGGVVSFSKCEHSQDRGGESASTVSIYEQGGGRMVKKEQFYANVIIEGPLKKIKEIKVKKK